METLLQKLMIVCCTFVVALSWCAGTTTDSDENPARRLAQCALERNELLGMCHSSLADKLALTDRVNNLMETLERIQKENVAVGQEYAGVLNEHHDVLDAYGSLQENHLSLQKKYEALQQDHLTLQKETEALQQDHLTLQKETEALQQDHLTLQKETEALQQDHSGLYKDYQNCLQNLGSLGKKYGTVTEELHSLKEHHSGLETDYQSLQQDNGRLLGLLQHSESNLRVVLQEKEQLSFTLKKKDQEIDISKRELALALKMKEELINEIKRFKDAWEKIDRKRREQHESLFVDNQKMKLKMEQENQSHRKELQNVNDLYLKSIREKNDKERTYLSTISACQAEKESLQKEKDDAVYEMYEMKDRMMQDFLQLEKNNTEIQREKDAMQSYYDYKINVCFNKRKADEAKAKDNMLKVMEMKDDAFVTLRKIEKNFTHLNWEKEAVEEYYSRSLQRCLAEQTTMQREGKKELLKILQREISIAEDLRKVSENNTLIQWEKDELEEYYVNLVRHSLLKMEQENQSHRKELQNVNDLYLKSIREKDDKERTYLSTITTCQVEKEGLEREKDDAVYEMLEMKDRMMQDFLLLEKNNTEIQREKEAMQSYYDYKINVCFNKRKADEAKAKDNMLKLVKMRDDAFVSLRKFEKNFTHLNWEKEAVEEYYSRSLQRCLAEQTTMQREEKKELLKILQREISIAEDLRKVSENNTLIQWEKDELEEYYVNLVRHSLLEGERRQKDGHAEEFNEVVLRETKDDTEAAEVVEGKEEEVESDEDLDENDTEQREVEESEGEIVEMTKEKREEDSFITEPNDLLPSWKAVPQDVTEEDTLMEMNHMTKVYEVKKEIVELLEELTKLSEEIKYMEEEQAGEAAKEGIYSEETENTENARQKEVEEETHQEYEYEDTEEERNIEEEVKGVDRDPEEGGDTRG